MRPSCRSCLAGRPRPSSRNQQGPRACPRPSREMALGALHATSLEPYDFCPTRLEFVRFDRDRLRASGRQRGMGRTARRTRLAAPVHARSDMFLKTYPFRHRYAPAGVQPSLLAAWTSSGSKLGARHRRCRLPASALRRRGESAARRATKKAGAISCSRLGARTMKTEQVQPSAAELSDGDRAAASMSGKSFARTRTEPDERVTPPHCRAAATL